MEAGTEELHSWPWEVCVGRRREEVAHETLPLEQLLGVSWGVWWGGCRGTLREMMAQDCMGRESCGFLESQWGKLCNPRRWQDPRGADSVMLPETGPSMPGCPDFLCPMAHTG